MSHYRIIAGLALVCLFGAAEPAVAATTRITCESRSDETRSCVVNTSGGVRLVRQLSTQGCWQNDTWGYDTNRIWVAQGCRAEFEVGAQANNSGSNGALAAAAVVGLAAAAVIASNQHDDHNHKNNNKNGNHHYNDDYDYGYYDRRYEEYDRHGYGNSRYGYNGYGGDPRRVFTCESHNGQRNYCSMPTRGHVEVYKQLSNKSCNFGRSWGTQHNEVWVDDGCRAEFAVY